MDKAPYCGPGHWKLIFAGSRFTKDAESRYAPVEGEALALVYGLQQCRMFVLGCPDLLVAVDHKPLVKLFSDQSLENFKNPRLLSLKEKTLMYRFTIKHVAGKAHVGPDAASGIRHLTPQATLRRQQTTRLLAWTSSDRRRLTLTQKQPAICTRPW